jgi:hypothetical protein
MNTQFHLYRELPNGKYQLIGATSSQQSFEAMCRLLKPDLVGGPVTKGL